MAVSHKQKPLKLALKSLGSNTTTNGKHTTKDADMMTVASQNSVISQLTEQVFQIKMENKQLLD